MPRKKTTKKQKKEAPTKELKWKDNRARLKVLDDFENGDIPLYYRELSAEDAWNTSYKDEPEFAQVTFAMFKARLKDHQKQAIKRKNRSIKLLQQDVKDEKHLTMSCVTLHNCCKEYKAYPAHKFKQRIYQAVKRE
eukprot:15365537-Ditylum_brightwellii.AAC.1